MTYALVVDGRIQANGALPASARRLDDGRWVMGLATAGVALQRACGWYEITDSGPPQYDPATHVLEPRTVSYNPLAGVSYVYTVRAKTADELAADVAAAQAKTERDQAKAAIADIDTFLALPTPSNAQVVAQVRLNARVLKRLIRDAFG